jgi:hypothetical protein
MDINTIKRIIREIVSVTHMVNGRDRKEAEILVTSSIVACRGSLTQEQINECLAYSKEVMNTYYSKNEKESA